MVLCKSKTIKLKHFHHLVYFQEKEKTSGHSTLLSKDMSVYEMVTDTVIPREWDAYIGNKKKLVEAAEANSDAK